MTCHSYNIDYIKQLNAFRDFRELNDISHAQADLYYTLLGIFNKAYWQSELAIPTRTIMSKANYSSDRQLRLDRERLIELGLIEYESGTKNKAGIYKIIVLHDDVSANVTDNDVTILPQSFRNNDRNPSAKSSAYNKTNTNTKTKTKTDTYTSAGEGDHAQIQAVFDGYNDICKSLPKAEKLTTKRVSQIRARLRSYGAERIEEAFKKAEQSDFLCGRKGDWKASFDWFMSNDGNILKVIEGNYDNNNDRNDVLNSSAIMPPTEGVSEIERQFMASYGGG